MSENLVLYVYGTDILKGGMQVFKTEKGDFKYKIPAKDIESRNYATYKEARVEGIMKLDELASEEEE